MLSQYTRFFRQLYSHNTSIRKVAGKKVKELAALLRNVPNTGNRSGLINFEKYILALLRFARGWELEGWFFDFLEGQGIIEWPVPGKEFILRQPPSRESLSDENFSEVLECLNLARQIADLIDPPAPSRPSIKPVRKIPKKAVGKKPAVKKVVKKKVAAKKPAAGRPVTKKAAKKKVGTIAKSKMIIAVKKKGKAKKARIAPKSKKPAPVKRAAKFIRRPGAVTKNRAKPPMRGEAAAPPDYTYLIANGGPYTNGGAPPKVTGADFYADLDVADGGGGTGTGYGGAGESKAAQPVEAEPDREVRVTGHDMAGNAVKEFKPAQNYVLKFSVGVPQAENLAEGDTQVKNVPKGGLKSRWVVSARGVEFFATNSIQNIEVFNETSVATFDLLIPDAGESETYELGLRPGADADKAYITIYLLDSGGMQEIYRELSVRLKNAGDIESDTVAKAVPHTHLRTTHEWTTPPEHVIVTIANGVAVVATQRAGVKNHDFKEPFSATDTLLNAAIDNVRKELEVFREAFGDYLDALDPVDMKERATKTYEWQPYFHNQDGWKPLADQADKAHREAFAAVLKSPEWRNLAHRGHSLFQAAFDKGSQLRELMRTLLPGSRIDFWWTKAGGAGWVSHVPWQLMYLDPVEVVEEEFADPERFMGLRYRLSARSWPGGTGSGALGGQENMSSVNMLYWGDKADDPVAAEVSWQKGEFEQRKQARFIPDRTKPPFKKQVMYALNKPGPSPVGVMYFYCHCNIKNGADPEFRFGNTAKSEDTLYATDLSFTPIPDGPLVFINACMSAQADAHKTSELERSFFERDVRAFIGTETRIPVKLASKFAWLFFMFLYRSIDKDPMAVGEALTQTRMFLWTQYKNVGGLFYSLTNQYELYVATNEEVAALAK